mgnify:CR=1 FL=1
MISDKYCLLPLLQLHCWKHQSGIRSHQKTFLTHHLKHKNHIFLTGNEFEAEIYSSNKPSSPCYKRRHWFRWINPSTTSAYQRSKLAGNIKKGTHTHTDINMKHEIAANAGKWKVPDWEGKHGPSYRFHSHISQVATNPRWHKWKRHLFLQWH